MNNKADDNIITNVAKLWVELGGDAVGLDYCFLSIKEKVEILLEERADEGEEGVWEK
jgi:hypothetical protein